jgi:hypothetical protein
MSITIIPNQPIRFQNEDSIDTSCDCLGQSFCQLINKNDPTQFQVQLNTDLITNGDFEDNLDDWEDNSSWQWDTGVAEYINGSGLNPLEQLNKLEVDKIYALTFTLNNDDSTEAGVRIDSFLDTPEYTESGTYTVVGLATSVDLTFTPFIEMGGDAFPTIDNVVLYEIPFYSIVDSEGNADTLENATGVTALGNIVQYEIDWTDKEEECFTIHISDGIINYISDCVSMKLEHDCTLLLSWTNDENAFGFDFADLEFTPRLRVKAKKWKPSYPKEKNVFKDNAGNRTILKSETSKEEILTISEMPEYLHDALAIGLEHDYFYIDGVEYTNEETEYTPKWRNSSQLAPVEVSVIKDQYLRNNSC